MMQGSTRGKWRFPQDAEVHSGRGPPERDGSGRRRQDSGGRNDARDEGRARRRAGSLPPPRGMRSLREGPAKSRLANHDPPLRTREPDRRVGSRAESAPRRRLPTGARCSALHPRTGPCPPRPRESPARADRCGRRSTRPDHPPPLQGGEARAERSRCDWNAPSQPQTVNEDPQPHVVLAFGLRTTNCAPIRSSR